MTDSHSLSPDVVDRVSFRLAQREDLERIVALIADDVVAAERTGAFGSAHVGGFEAIEDSPNDELVVAVLDGQVVGVMQLTYIPGVARGGAKRLHIEAVRIDRTFRGLGLGRLFMEHAHQRGRDRGCTLAQLTSDKQRPDAHGFYEGLGYVPSHVGFKRAL